MKRELNKDIFRGPLASGSTLGAREIARFDERSREWWNPRGKFSIIQKFNAVRLEYIIAAIAHRFRRDTEDIDELVNIFGIPSKTMCDCGDDVLEANSIKFLDNAKLASWVPPFPGPFIETSDFAGAERATRRKWTAKNVLVQLSFHRLNVVSTLSTHALNI